MHPHDSSVLRNTSLSGKRPRVRTPIAAAYIGCSQSALCKARVYGGGPPFYKVGSCVVYDLDEIDLWLLARRRLSTAESSRRAGPACTP